MPTSKFLEPPRQFMRMSLTMMPRFLSRITSFPTVRLTTMSPATTSRSRLITAITTWETMTTTLTRVSFNQFL